MEINWKPNWHKGEIIRQVLTGRPFLVVHIYKLDTNQTATCVIDAENRIDPAPLKVISQGEYDHYVRDLEMEVQKDGDVVKFKYHPLKL